MRDNTGELIFMGHDKHMGSAMARCSGRILGALLVLAFASSVAAQTFRAGPINLTVGVTTGLEFTDNYQNSESNRESDLKLTIGPTVSGGITFPFTLRGGEKLTLQTSFSYTYKISLKNKEEQSFGSPISASLVLPIQVEQWTVTASDTFSFNNEPLETAWAFNRNKVAQYSNTAAINATRQFGRFSVTAATQRSDKINPDDPDLEETAYLFSLTPAFYFRENYSIFWRNSIGINDLTAPSQRDSVGYSSEIGVSGQITPQLVGSVSVGYAHTTIEANGTNAVDNVDGISSTIALSYAHPLRPNTTHSLSFYRSPGVTALLKDTAVTEVTGVSYTISHRLSRYITLSPTIAYSHLEAIGGTSNEKTDLVQASIALSRSFTRHLSGNINYYYQLRSSNLDNGSYYVNKVVVNLTYTF